MNLHPRSTRIPAVLASASGAVLLLAGCAGIAAEAGDAPPTREDLPPIQQSDEQRATVADGVVDEQEYADGFERYQSCMSEAGWSLVSVEETGYLIEYSVPEEAVVRGDDDRCYQREFAEVDTRWQLAHEDESYTTRLYQRCLSEAGVTPTDEADAVFAQLGEHGIDQGVPRARRPVDP